MRLSTTLSAFESQSLRASTSGLFTCSSSALGPFRLPLVSSEARALKFSFRGFFFGYVSNQIGECVAPVPFGW